MKKTLKYLLIGIVVGTSVFVVNAYNTQIWNPIQFVEKLFLTPKGELNSQKAYIKLDGNTGRIDAKSVYVNGKNVLTSEKDPTVKSFAKKDLPKCKVGYVLTSTDGRNFKCVKDEKGSGGSIIIANGIIKTIDGYYIVDSTKVSRGCNDSRILNKSQCILKIGSFYVAPKFKEVKLYYSDAVNYCKSLSVGGKSGWRMPSMGELVTIYRNKSKVYRLISDWYLSSTRRMYGYRTIRMSNNQRRRNSNGYIRCISR